MNISPLAKSEQRLIELNRQASLLIYNQRIGKVSRSEILTAIRELPVDEQNVFKQLLNKYQDQS